MSVQAVPRDYSLSGGSSRAIALDDVRIEGRMEGVWWKPKVSRPDLRALMERSDGPALWHFTLWFVLLALSILLAIASWGTWWAIPAFLIYGTIYSSSDARWHECGLGTPFRTPWLNEVFYHISSFMTLREAYLWRWSHSRHHTDTYFVGKDPEIQVQRPADLLKILMDFLYLRSGPRIAWTLVSNAIGWSELDVRDFVLCGQQGAPAGGPICWYWPCLQHWNVTLGLALEAGLMHGRHSVISVLCGPKAI